MMFGQNLGRVCSFVGNHCSEVPLMIVAFSLKNATYAFMANFHFCEKFGKSRLCISSFSVVILISSSSSLVGSLGLLTCKAYNAC
uniref:Uncharacterized protein n=1 Tax=Rhizophora mucronata TaxID=61149 RepID=A0A2P2Q3X4_RHIMU